MHSPALSGAVRERQEADILPVPRRGIRPTDGRARGRAAAPSPQQNKAGNQGQRYLCRREGARLMLGREPRLPHVTLRWLIITLMLVNGVQLVLLQATINAALSLGYGQTWTYVGLSLVALLISVGLIAYAFARSRGRK